MLRKSLEKLSPEPELQLLVGVLISWFLVNYSSRWVMVNWRAGHGYGVCQPSGGERPCQLSLGNPRVTADCVLLACWDEVPLIFRFNGRNTTATSAADQTDSVVWVFVSHSASRLHRVFNVDYVVFVLRICPHRSRSLGGYWLNSIIGTSGDCCCCDPEFCDLCTVESVCA